MSSPLLIHREGNRSAGNLEKPYQIAYNRARHGGLVYRPDQTGGAARLDVSQSKLNRRKLTLSRIRIDEHARIAAQEQRSNPFRMRSQNNTGLGEIKAFERIEYAGQESPLAQRQESLGKAHSGRLTGGQDQWSDIFQQDVSPGWRRSTFSRPAAELASIQASRGAAAMVSNTNAEKTNMKSTPAILVLIALLWGLLPAHHEAFTQVKIEDKAKAPPLEKSSYFAFVDRDYIFTVELPKPRVLLFNFISMVDKDHSLQAKQIRLTLENRKIPGKFFMIDTGDPKEPVLVPSLRMRPRSSFGVRLQADFGDERELLGVTIRLGEEDFKLVPLASFDFENLSLKVNRINLDSPDFRDDWRVLKLEMLGARGPGRP